MDFEKQLRDALMATGQQDPRDTLQSMFNMPLEQLLTSGLYLELSPKPLNHLGAHAFAAK